MKAFDTMKNVMNLLVICGEISLGFKSIIFRKSSKKVLKFEKSQKLIEFFFLKTYFKLIFNNFF